MDLIYKDADINDIDILIDIYNSAFYDDYIRYGKCQAYGKTKEQMENSLRNYPKTIAYNQQKAVGVISYTSEKPGEYYIGCLGVIKEDQGCGIGTNLMNYFMTNHSDWTEITLVTPKDNERNIKFYTEHFGFEVTGEEDDGTVVVLLFRLNR